MEDASFKECPFCKEKIRKEAVKCRFCGEWFEQSEQANANSNATEPAPPPISIQNESPAPKIKKETSSKVRIWISVTLLLFCGLVWFAGFASVHWSQLTPADGEAVGKIIGGLLMVFFVVALTIRDIKGKTEKLFALSIILTVTTAIGIYYFLDARHKTQEKVAASDRQFVSDLNRIQEFLKQGAVGDIPQFKPTGDPDNDAISQVMNDFYRNYVQAFREAYSGLQKLNEVDVFEDSLLTNKFSLELEIGNRTAGQQIIQTLATNTISMLESAGKEYESQNVSEKSKQDVRKTFDNLNSQFKTMFSSMIKQQKTDQDFLQFLDGNFADFQVKDGKILFATDANVQKYSDLAKNVQDATAEVQGLQAQATARTDAFKTQFGK